MLDVEYTPVIEKAGSKETTEVTRRDDGTYWLTYRNALCPDMEPNYEAVSEGDLKVMRARYLVTRADSYRHLRAVDDATRNHDLRTFFGGGTWTPREGTALSARMGMVRRDGMPDREE